MATLIRLTRSNGKGSPFYLNADRIIVVESTLAGSTVFHDPININNDGADWENVQESPDEISRLVLDTSLSARHLS